MEDRFTDTAQCVERLYETWQRHGRLLVSADMDATLFDFRKRGETYPRTIGLLKRCQKLGWLITIFTASAESRHPEILAYAQSLGLIIASINKNPIDKLIYGRAGKIFYNLLLDDRCGLGQACEILSLTLDKVEGTMGV